jgi:hypothetical protein
MSEPDEAGDGNEGSKASGNPPSFSTTAPRHKARERSCSASANATRKPSSASILNPPLCADRAGPACGRRAPRRRVAHGWRTRCLQLSASERVPLSSCRTRLPNRCSDRLCKATRETIPIHKEVAPVVAKEVLLLPRIRGLKAPNITQIYSQLHTSLRAPCYTRLWWACALACEKSSNNDDFRRIVSNFLVEHVLLHQLKRPGFFDDLC